MTAFTSPHFQATEAGLDILNQGGTAIEAMVAAAATIAVVYPHMNGLGGDGFWLISEPNKPPYAIDAAGYSASLATKEFYSSYDNIPSRGGLSALTMAGAVSGWRLALAKSQQWQENLPLRVLFKTAIDRANNGFVITKSLQDASEKTFEDFSNFEQFKQFRENGNALKEGQNLQLSKLGRTLSYLADSGLDEFYSGDVARQIATDLEKEGSPLRFEDFKEFTAQYTTPLKYSASFGELFNLPEPTQGIASLLILALYDQLQTEAMNQAERIHLLVECTKQAFLIRNEFVTDSSRLPKPLESFLQPEFVNTLCERIQTSKAMPWPHEAKPGDTVWLGACDGQGRMVSYIQSLYWEFGSGIVSPSTGIVWNNRGTSFSLAPDSNQLIAPRIKPFHTLNPAYACLKDGRRIVYGTMGGEGQPQTQAALLTRYVFEQQSLKQSVSLPRWLLGRTWGDQSHNLKIESDLSPEIVKTLAARGHDVAQVAAKNEMMGHAGAICLTANGNIDATTDPRSDGSAYP